MDYEQLSHSASAQLDERVVEDHFPEKVRLSAQKRFGYLVFLLTFLLGLILLPSLAQRISFSLTLGAESARRQEAMKLLSELPEASSRIAWIVKAVGPSVVGIRTDNASHGTGIVIDERGYILTNLHVIRPASGMANRIEVRLDDGRSQTDGVLVVGVNVPRDLAVLRVDMTDLQPLRWGSSEKLEVGETVVAIGNPYGLDHSVSMGIVSAKKRFNMTPDGVIVQEYLQTDAAINPGNSGGPLVNLRGELVGVNTAILGESYSGISFAIPSDLAHSVCDEIISGAKE